MTRLVFLALACSAIVGCGEDRSAPEPYDLDFDIPRSETFSDSLSAYGLYEEPLSSLQPGTGAIPYELSSQLFTDYAFKQRFLKLPEGSSITVVDNTTLESPEGTILVKTFYYPSDMRDPAGPRRVIETRLLVRTGGLWNVATYLWNAEQTDATLLLTGTTTEISWIDEAGRPRTTDYVVPHEGECVTCHQSGGSSAFIGLTLRNLNRIVTRSDDEVNQLDYLVAEGVLDSGDWASAPSIPDYEDPDLPLDSRARAYLDINCAHCHNPGGWDGAFRPDLDLRFQTPLNQTGIPRKASDLERQVETGQMPNLGTTLLHDEGVRLVLEYVDSL
jgi:uncharacterized repeat protein (TIGR03806 family)